MTGARRFPLRLILPPGLALAAWVAASAGFEGRSGEPLERIDWDHPTLELFLASVGDVGDRARLELCVRTHPGVAAGSTSVGFPRYRTAWGRWVDAVIQGVGSNHLLQTSAAEGPACFSVVVARGATALDLPIGGRALEIEIGAWLEAPRDGAGPTLAVEDGWDRVAVPPSEPERVFPEPLQESAPPSPPPPLIPDVDRIIPSTPWLRPTGLAVVLGVEAYADAPPATYAAADARTAALYFEQALGIPAERIELLLDAEVTLGQLHRLFDEDGWLARRTAPDSEVFVFFAGHGMAELQDFAPYLLPTDADPNYVRQTAFPVDRMVESLAALGARRTTLFLDTCFGGLSREGMALLDRARPLVLVPLQPAPTGISVFSAGAGSQIASSLDDQGHGLFSYHLFKGLGGEADLDLDRRVSAGELKRYLEDAVPRAAQALDREQFPAIALEDPEQLLVQLP
jgi:hypothetical protein